MKILGVNHFFEQDLHALHAFAPQHELRVIPYAWLRDLSMTVFPARNYTDWNSYSEPAFAERERVWDERIAPLLEHIRARFPFEILILPSDVIFYLRALVRWCQARGIPTIVTQKETSITDETMYKDSLDLLNNLTFMSDRMTINSERHKRFWIRSGAEADKLTVTGQPRFDEYARARNMERRPGPPRVLFLSYLSNAYIPTSHPLSSWSRLHTETLDVLGGVAREGAEVRIKPHPQQDRIALQEVRDARDALGEIPGAFELLDGDDDTRRLIRDADIVVGFQTTALYEAVMAGKPVLYTNWTVPAEFEARLLAYDGFGEALRCVTSAAELQEHLERLLGAVQSGDPTVVMDDDATQRCEFQLGPIDGRACERVWKVLESYAGQASPPATPSTPRRLWRRRAALVAAKLAYRLGGRKAGRMRTRRNVLRSEIGLQGDLPSAHELLTDDA